MNSSWSKIADAVYMLSSTYSPNQSLAKESFVCLFECLRDLLPDAWYQQAITTFMIQEKIDPYLKDKTNLMRWVYKLNSYINLLKRRQGQLINDNLTFEQILENYQFLTKNDWGNGTWFLTHFLAANLPILTEKQKIAFKAYIVCLCHILPCPECRTHMNEYLQKSNINLYLNKENGAYVWTWEFHNEVNLRLGKPIMEMRPSLNLYILANTRNKIYDNNNYTIISEEFA